MGKEKEPLDNYSIEELEALLAKRKLQARETRLQRFRETGRALPIGDRQSEHEMEKDYPSENQAPLPGGKKTGIRFSRILRSAFNRLLLWVEIAAVFGMVYVFFRGFGLLQLLNHEISEAITLPSPTSTALIAAIVLPSGHMPPSSPGGPAPNDAEIPSHLRPLVQSLPAIPVPTPGPEHARQIFVEALWPNPQPIVQGDGWEQLKKGVGQHIGSGNPGKAGNLVLSAHNDIFGELFKHLDKLGPGDKIKIYTETREYTYIVTGLRIVEPTEVSVMEPTEKATITLISCYPYLIDSHRIVVFGELQERSISD